MPAFAVWNYANLVRSNRLARLFFERSHGIYLSDPRAVRDLLESPQIHVQARAFRVLGEDEPRTRAQAAASLDLLQATLLRPLHRKTRMIAFGALRNAAGGIFAEEGEVTCGTTNVDFTAWLWAALAEMRSSRETWSRIEKQGLEVRTEGAGGRFEQKVELPESWVRGFLQLQGAMALPGTVVGARPVDVLAAIRFLRFTKAKISPRAVRYVFEPGHPVQLVLEPWEQRFELKGTEHGGDTARTIRTWGRRRLKLIEVLLPYAERVEICSRPASRCARICRPRRRRRRGRRRRSAARPTKGETRKARRGRGRSA